MTIRITRCFGLIKFTPDEALLSKTNYPLEDFKFDREALEDLRKAWHLEPDKEESKRADV